MRTMMIGIGVLAVGVLAGCASDVGEHGTTLRSADERALGSQVLYLVQGLSVPLTATQMDEQDRDLALAVPVRVEVFENVAVAWHAPAGEPLIGRANIRALWAVVDRQPISDELAPDAITPIEPDDGDASYQRPNTGGEIPGVPDLGLDEPAIAPYADPVGVVIIDFHDVAGGADEAWMLEEIAAGHPGCL